MIFSGSQGSGSSVIVCSGFGVGFAGVGPPGVGPPRFVPPKFIAPRFRRYRLEDVCELD